MIHSITSYTLNMPSFPQVPQYAGPCSDQLVGYINFNGTTFEYQGGDVFSLTRKIHVGQRRNDVNYSTLPTISKNKAIVVLLESPHVDEFQVVQQTYLTAPAWGSTGNRFNTQFIKVLNRHIALINSQFPLRAKEDFDVYIINAIQYQCSLGIRPINKTRRDYVFSQLWNQFPDSFEQDLIDRLNFVNPDLIINACTINLQRKRCNKAKILPLLARQVSFLESSEHMSAWSKNTILR